MGISFFEPDMMRSEDQTQNKISFWLTAVQGPDVNAKDEELSVNTDE
jgi:hypothetical protein